MASISQTGQGGGHLGLSLRSESLEASCVQI